MSGTKQSIILKVKTKHGGEVSEYHTSEYSAQQGLVNMVKDGVEVLSADISREAERGLPEGNGAKKRLKAYGEVE